jgi:5'-methylthioadenosine phosphorylase
MLAVIGGTGFYRLGENLERKQVLTPHGIASVNVVSVEGKKMVFIPRHGSSHSIAPHRIDFKANISALEKLGVTRVLSFYSCGIISKYKPGELILIEDFIGLWTPATLYDDFTGGMKHVDFTEPFNKKMQKQLMKCATLTKTKLHKGGIIAGTTGPRFETKAEIRLLKAAGANLVNMTCGQEMALLGESQIDFVSIGIGSNFAAGVKKEPLSDKEMVRMAHQAKGRLNRLILQFVKEKD